MDGYRRCLRLFLSVGVLALSGASCPRLVQQFAAPVPRILPPSPTLEQVIHVVNQNNSRIHSFCATQATLSGPGIPSLRASLAFQRPKRLRLRAETAVSGTELDFGSNDELFWFWVKRAQPPAVYFCRHERFATSPVQRRIPFDPQWLIEALGISELDPLGQHEGPIPLAGDRLQIRTIRDTARGPVTKVTIIDGRRGCVLEQHLYDANSRLLASSLAEGHRRDPLSNLVMPTSVKVHCPMAEFSVRIDLGCVQINRLSGNPAELWAMPRFPGAEMVDLGDPNLGLPQAAGPPAVSSRHRGPPPGWSGRRY